MSDELDRIRREMHAVLQQPGVRPDDSLQITRRTFIHRSLLFGAASVGQTFAWWPLLNTIDVAHAAEAPFKFAWISDTHLYEKSLNTRFVDKVVRAVQEVQAMDPPADFLIFGGDLAQLGKIEELELGVDLLKDLTIKKYYIPGEHDWYLDMGKKWGELFGQPNWTFDHKGVRFIGLDTVSRGPDYWTVKKMTPEERMGHMATLDGTSPARGPASAATSSTGCRRYSPTGISPNRSSSSAIIRSTSITRPGTSGCATGAK